MLDCLELLDVDDATVVANDTAGGLLLLSLASGHPALGRIGRLVLTNCDNYDQFPPDALRKAARFSRGSPASRERCFACSSDRRPRRRKIAAGAAANGLDAERADSFFAPGRRDPRVAGDLVAAMAGFHQQLLLDAAPAIPRFDRPVLLVWGESCDFFPLAHAHRLASEFPDATLVSVPGAKTWVPIDDPARGGRRDRQVRADASVLTGGVEGFGDERDRGSPGASSGSRFPPGRGAARGAAAVRVRARPR